MNLSRTIVQLYGISAALAACFGVAMAVDVAFSPSGLAKSTIPAVVLIDGTTVTGDHVAGSGFIVESSGMIVTNLHVIRDLKRASVKVHNGDVYDDVRVRAFDERKDLAIIQIPAYGLPTLRLADSDSVGSGDPVALVGNPLQLEGTITTGVISGVRTSELGYRVIQTDAAANPGNSGGPLVDARGFAVGVLCFKITGSENLNFVIPMNYARGMLASGDSYTLAEMRARLTNDVPIIGTTQFPTRWKSLTSGNTKLVRVVGDHVYVETVMSAEAAAQGMFSTMDLMKQDSIYVGTARAPHVCLMRDGLNGQTWWKFCPAEDSPCTITLFTPTRIEGFGEGFKSDDPNFDCYRCRVRGPAQRETFVWIPE